MADGITNFLTMSSGQKFLKLEMSRISEFWKWCPLSLSAVFCSGCTGLFWGVKLTEMMGNFSHFKSSDHSVGRFPLSYRYFFPCPGKVQSGQYMQSKSVVHPAVGVRSCFTGHNACVLHCF